MMIHTTRAAGDSVWRKVGEKAVITAVTTLLSEAIKASVELVKKAKLREQKAEFDDRRARDKKGEEPSEAQPDEADEERDDALDEDVADETDAAESNEPAEDKPAGDKPVGGGPKLDFESYVASKRT